MGFRKAAVIYNPVAGGGFKNAVRRVGEAAEALRQHVPEVLLTPTKPGRHADVLAREAVEQGCDLIAPCGGDGTINEALQGVVGTGVTMAPLPAGTANVFAWETGLPVDPVKAADALPTLVAREVELGVVELPEEGVRRYFLLMCGAGVDANAVYRLNLGLKRRAGIFAYFWSASQQLFQKFERLEVKTDGETVGSTLAVASKSRLYGGKLVLTPHAHLLEHQFDVVTFPSSSPLVYTGYLAGALVQQLDRFSGVGRRRAQQIEFLNTNDSLHVYVQADGELIGKLPAKITMGPETVRLLLPPDYVRAYPEPRNGGG
jgi:diacylglycerol kinase family enzyme